MPEARRVSQEQTAKMAGLRRRLAFLRQAVKAEQEIRFRQQRRQTVETATLAAEADLWCHPRSHAVRAVTAALMAAVAEAATQQTRQPTVRAATAALMAAAEEDTPQVGQAAFTAEMQAMMGRPRFSM